MGSPPGFDTSRASGSPAVADRPVPGGRLIIVLIGPTGSGKTELLGHLADNAAQTLDLEKLARHRGSAFGAMGRPAQLSHTTFQASIRAVLAGGDQTSPLWIEDKGEYLGGAGLPPELAAAMRSAPCVEVRASATEDRVRRILDDYGRFPISDWLAAVDQIAVRLGPRRTLLVRDALTRDDRAGAVGVLLTYYDAAYRHRLDSLGRRVLRVVDGRDLAEAARHLAGSIDLARGLRPGGSDYRLADNADVLAGDLGRAEGEGQRRIRGSGIGSCPRGPG